MIRIPMPETGGNFLIQELVTPEIFQLFKDKNKLQAVLRFFDPTLLASLRAVRLAFGPTIVNTWHKDLENGFRYRGLRPIDCPVGALHSQHKFGRAIDCHFTDVTAEEARQYILSNRDKFEHITAIEGQVNWLHFDVRIPNWRGIKVFNP